MKLSEKIILQPKMKIPIQEKEIKPFSEKCAYKFSVLSTDASSNHESSLTLALYGPLV